MKAGLKENGFFNFTSDFTFSYEVLRRVKPNDIPKIPIVKSGGKRSVNRLGFITMTSN